MKFSFPYTERQRRLVEHPARILHIGAGTKTGKSAALFCWLIEGLLNGEATCYCGPWFFRSRAAFDQVKILLQPFIARRVVRVNEARLQIRSTSNGYLDFVSGDNPDAAFGGNYHRIVVDEASRQPSAIYAAALTTISATNGKLRLAFNLELGSKNWAVANLLRVQRLTVDERARTGEDFLTFPTGGDGLVDPALVELMKSQMPESLWKALYLGVIPESDASLFRNLDEIFKGRELEKPVDGCIYFIAADLARKSDWTVVTVIDDNGRVVASDRFNQISWALQVERVGLLYRTFRCQKVIYDATGVGDAVGENLESAGMTTEPFIFTVPSRRALIEELVLCCDAGEISIPNTSKFQIYRQELESMEVVLDGTSVRYSVPGNAHDDALFSLALAAHAYRESRGAVLGFIDLLKRRAREVAEGIRDFAGNLLHKPAPALPVSKPAPPPVAKTPEETRCDNFKLWQQTHKTPPCSNCGDENNTTYTGPYELLCKQCGAVNGILQRSEKVVGVNCCGDPLPQTVAGHKRCGNCGKQDNGGPPPRGFSFAQLHGNKFPWR